ncbi:MULTISPECIES: 3-phenylpropionate/cinnamic acid dioxygenase subunit beta [unclassified Beijerinckia]|uniref:3-phenylpropionate/cinnamic acid dioxygenase subunit beta n=1 Tax=unclassified Beijerinckia TaxID=2638183 RepID=UPI0008963D5D|nr:MULTISPECIES: 3-phenylpropionate/cinnamic acid dioxygenase subunit beta [unclassified Beijerinckia]MDH7799040.1 ethylbenzene dioxygenase beta subunit [Beijerinckia sp. GAS462]SED96994.1 ethylbenzene dioxygenase beta subunit [Beijerinckia sp. 28-YEA-48]
MLDMPHKIEALIDRPVPDALLREVERFYYTEARLLDAENYAGWLAMVDPDIHYWMPGIETRRRDDKRGPYAYGEMAYFDDDYRLLSIRVARYNQPTAWADNPATRHAHLISNIEAFETDDPSLIAGFSAFTNVRNRNLKDQDVIHGRREDILHRHTDGALKLLNRRVLIVQDILLSKNLNTFF